MKRLGGDGITTPTERTDDQTIAGIYWAYDGTPSLCAPPRLYNQITEVIADADGIGRGRAGAALRAGQRGDGRRRHRDLGVEVLLQALAAGHRDPRGRSGHGTDGHRRRNPLTRGDATFSPLGAPASNLDAPNFTPPFPAYPSGHAGFGGALFQILRKVYGRDDIPFTFVSDELNGVTVDNEGVVRPLLPRSFTSLSHAEEENGQSRIYLGIHWSFDKTAGIAQGRRVADYVFTHAFRPL